MTLPFELLLGCGVGALILAVTTRTRWLGLCAAAVSGYAFGMAVSLVTAIDALLGLRR